MNTLHIIAWFLLVASAFGAFITFAQQGKGYSKNTFWYNHKTIIGIVFIVVIIACGAFLKLS